MASYLAYILNMFCVQSHFESYNPDPTQSMTNKISIVFIYFKRKEKVRSNLGTISLKHACFIL